MKMHECKSCGATWTGSKKCPYCHTIVKDEEINSPDTNVIRHDGNQINLGKNKTFMPKFITGIVIALFILTAGIVFGVIAGVSEYNDDYSYEIPPPSRESEQNLAYQREKGIYNGNFYKVGEDIPAGEYLVKYYGVSGSTDFHINVYTDESASDDSKIYTNWTQNCMYVVLEEGTYIEQYWSAIYDLEKNPDIVLDPLTDSGMYKIGRDLEAGTYTFVLDDDYSGHYEVYSSLNSLAPISKSNGIIYKDDDEETQITLFDGDYIEMKYCHLKK